MKLLLGVQDPRLPAVAGAALAAVLLAGASVALCIDRNKTPEPVPVMTAQALWGEGNGPSRLQEAPLR